MLTPVGVFATVVSGLTSIDGVKLSFSQPVIAASGAENRVGVHTPGSCHESALTALERRRAASSSGSLPHDVGSVRNGWLPRATATHGPPVSCWWQWLGADGSPHSVSMMPSALANWGMPDTIAEMP